MRPVFNPFSGKFENLPAWVEFLKLDSNPGGTSANTLYQDDGTNYEDGTLVWENKSVFLDEMSIGDPGFEQGEITVNGTTYDSILKVNEFGGTRSASQILHRHADTANIGAVLGFARARGNTSAHTVVQDGDTVGQLDYVAWDGTDYALGASLEIEVDGTPGNNDMPMRFVFKTSPDGTQAPTEKMRIASDAIYVNGSQPLVFQTSTLDTKIVVRRDDSDASVNLGLVAHSDTAGRGGVLFAGRSRGTEGAETVVQNGDTLFNFAAVGHDGTDYGLAGNIIIKMADSGTISATSMPGAISFQTTEDGAVTGTEKLLIDKNGVVFNDGSNGYYFRAETIGDEYALYNDGTNDTWVMGNTLSQLTINGLDVRPKLLIDRNAGDSNINFISFSNLDSSSAGAFMVWARARGSTVGPTTLQAVQNGDRGGVFRMDMHDGTQFVTTGNFAFSVDGAVSTGIVPTGWSLQLMDPTGTLFTPLNINSSGRMFFNSTGGADITFFEDGGIRANQLGNSAATADFIYGMPGFSNGVRIDVSATQFNVANSSNQQGGLLSADVTNQVVDINKFNTGANLRIESSSAGVNLWESDTTNNKIISNGGRVDKITRKTAAYTLTASDHIVFVNTDSAAVTITLPAGIEGTHYIIKNTGSSGNAVTINPNGSETIVGATSFTLLDGEDLDIHFNATDYWY